MTWAPAFPDTARGRYDAPVHAHLADVNRVRDAVRQSGAATMLDQWETLDRARRDKFHRGGRPPWLTSEQVLVLRHLCSLYGHLSYESVTALLCFGMDARALSELGIEFRKGDTPERVAGRVYASCKRVESIIDPYPRSAFFKRRYRHRGAAFNAYKATLDDEHVAARKDRASRWMNAFIHITWVLTPAWLRERYRGNVVTDSTFLKAAARGHKKAYTDDTWISTDPFAGPYVREGDHSDTEENKAATGVKTFKKIGWGYELTTVVSCPNDPTRDPTFPTLILGVGLDRPGAKPSELTVKALAYMREKGIPAGFIAGDRNYGNHPLPEKWAFPLVDLGYRQVFDMRKKDLADVRLVDGAAILEGNAYCPLIMFNDTLVNATLDFRYGRTVTDPTTGKRTTRRLTFRQWRDLIDERAKYLLIPHGRPTRDGTMRYRCPATDPRPTVSCPLRLNPEPDDSQMPADRVRLPIPEYRGGFCNNASGIATLLPTPRNAIRPDAPTRKPADVVLPRELQPIQFGSKEWGVHYGVFRNTVESVNDTLKNRHTIRFESAHGRRARGYAATAIYAALAVLAHNVKQLNRFLAKPAPVDRDGRGKEKIHKYRRRDLKDGYGLPRFWTTTEPPRPDEIRPDSYDDYPEAA